MTRPSRFHTLLWLAAGLLAAMGAGLLARAELQRQREAFDTDTRIVHRLLSQRVVQHDAVLATLALLQPVRDGEHAEQRLPAVFPQVLQARRRSEGEAWPQTSLTQAEATSRARRRAALGAVDLAQGRYELVTAAGSGAYALLIDLKQTVPRDEWPMQPASSPVRVRLVLGDTHFTVQPGAEHTPTPSWTFHFTKVLASESQPFDVQPDVTLGWSALPWWRMGTWVALVLAAAYVGQAWRRQGTARRRAEELLRLGQVARLNTLGELAAGVAHELNQPLTAVLANTQAAQRLLADDTPDLPLAQTAMTQAAEQARRVAEVVGRLCRVVDRAGTLRALQRADNAGPHTVGAAQGKAFTSASARANTTAMLKNVQKNPGAQTLVDIPGFLVLGGGVPVRVGNEVIGAVGVGGAPGGHLDEQCANAGIAKVAELLK